ncbi:MAG: DUF4080 domain-containing protein [Bacillota bacterium]
MDNRYLLAAINAKYTHSNLAVRYLKAFCRDLNADISLLELSINDSFSSILSSIYNANANIIAFSCYIWNIELVLKLCSSIKKVLPECIIILGGPEVSYDSKELLEKHSYIDYIVIGEGELAFRELVQQLNSSEKKLPAIDGVCSRANKGIRHSKPAKAIDSLDIIPFAYEDFMELKNKIIYYETSRGCPFNCQYCLSSTMEGVRFFSMERVKADIDIMIKNQVSQVKLVDRTFNCSSKRSIEIMQYIIGKNAKTNFHFEVAADLIDDTFLEVVRKAPQGMFQFEIGVQSTNPDTLSEIRRKMNFERVRSNVEELLKIGNAHIHLDLIAGLPYEGIDSFKKSFNAVIDLGPQMLQLGFLKLLKGSGIRERASEYEVKYNEHPPYEVLSTKWMSYPDLLLLKNMEKLLETFYNSGVYARTIKLIKSYYNNDLFEFFREFTEYCNSREYFTAPRSAASNCSVLYSFMLNKYSSSDSRISIFNESVKFDWISNNGNSIVPDMIKRYDYTDIRDIIHTYIKASSSVHEFYLKHGYTDLKNLLKQIYYEIFFIDITDTLKDGAQIVFFIKNPAKDEKSFISMSLKELLNASK